MKQNLIVLMLAAVLGATAGEVKIGESAMTIPTYEPGGYDKNPIFYTGRVYQGAQGRVYPYPLQDVLHDERVEKEWKTLTLKNDWLEMTVLPDLGGRLFDFSDKQTGYDIFYRQHVIKPALIGILGAWTSGGVEWNFPHHHRATTYMPVSWRLDDDPVTGRKTVWIGETEFRRRLKWTIGLTMSKDRAVLEADCRFMNRQDMIESMLYWANVSVHCGNDYQVIFPPSCRIGFDHHKNFWTSFPMGPKVVDHQWLVSQRSESADDISGEVDLSWWKNFTAESRSIFALDLENSWLAGFDHGRNLGTVHVGNRHVMVGKKFFLWGNFPEAFVWDKVLTDTDGPYLELMVGGFSDNQPDYSWIAPHETRTLKQFWYPVKGIGGVKNATIDGCVNLERRGADKVFLGFNSTRTLKGARVTLTDGVNTETATIDIDPNTPWSRTLTLKDATVKDQQLTGRLQTADGRLVVEYTPVADIQPPLPPKVENPRLPAEYDSVEELYLTGLRLDQFHNGMIDPIPYWLEALKRDPLESRSNLALGIRRAKECRFAEAEEYLRRAVRRATRNYTRAKDAEPHYMLGVVLMAQDKLKEAEDELWKATWTHGFQAAGFFELARIACRRAGYAEALELVDRALARNADCAKTHALKAYILRKLDPRANRDAALAELDASARLDPLDYFGVVERALLEGRSGEAVRTAETNRGLKAQELVECVCDYFGLGAWDGVKALTRQAKAIAAAERPAVTTLDICASYVTPVFDYLLGYALAKTGDTDGAKAAYRAADAMTGDWYFPSRSEELAALKSAVELVPESANAWYYLGTELYDLEQRDAAVSAWKRAVELNPSDARSLRNLGFAFGREDATRAQGREYYLKAIAADPSNVDAILEEDKLAEKLNIPAAERLAVMTRNAATCATSDPTMLRMAYLHNELGDYDSSLAILTTRRFHVWEGGEGLLTPFVDALLLRGLKKLDAKDFDGALADMNLALTYPENLQAGRPGGAGTAPKTHYYIARVLRAAGKPDAATAELRKSLKGWIAGGEMNYYRILAMRELGERQGEAENLSALDAAIAALEAPAPKVVDAYAKFGGENSPMERALNNVWTAKYLRGLRLLLDGKDDAARALFDEVTANKPAILWARAEATWRKQ